MLEIWKDIEGYNGDYKISNLGRVLSLKKEGKFLLPEKVIKDKYYRVCLYNSGVKKRHFVHRLVAEHFLLKVGNSNIVNHIDNNGLNNSVDNLEWVTVRENLSHCTKSKYVGVQIEVRGNYIRYRSSVRVNGKLIRKSHKTEEEAHNEYLNVLKQNNIYNRYSGSIKNP